MAKERCGDLGVCRFGHDVYMREHIALTGVGWGFGFGALFLQWFAWGCRKPRRESIEAR